MIIDAHTHVWPDRIAELALSSNPVPGLAAQGNGTVSGLTKDMAGSGVAISCCLGIANQARHVESVNAFVAGLQTDSRIGFGTVHVDLSVEENLVSLERHRLRGIKIHPLFQRFALDDRRLWGILDALPRDIAVIAHVGGGGDAHTNALSSPAMIRELVRQFPDLRLVACHFGGYKLLDDAEELLTGLDIVLETSWPPTLSSLQPDRIRRLIRKHGAERVAFGSDWPMTSPRAEIAAIDALGLNDDETKLVLGGTLAGLLGVESSWS